MSGCPSLRRLALPAAAVLLAWLAVCSTAARADLRLSTVARHAASAMLTDGERWAAYAPVKGRTRAIDTRTGRSVVRVDPPGCPGGPLAVGGGFVLYACDRDPQSGDDRRAAIVDLASGEAHDAVGFVAAVGDPSPESSTGPIGIGARWLVLMHGAYHANDVAFLEWRTGRVVVLQQARPSIVDLDAAEPVRPLCRPLGFAASDLAYEDFSGTYFEPTTFDASFAIVSELQSRAWLRRCGSRRRVALPRPARLRTQWVVDQRVGGGVAVWSLGLDDESLQTFVTRLDAARPSWHGAVLTVHLPLRNARVSHTSTRMYGSSFRERSATYRIVSARIP